MKKLNLIFTFFFLLNQIVGSAQSPNIPSDNQSYERVQDLEITKGVFTPGVYSTIRPFNRTQVLTLVNEMHISDSSSEYIKTSSSYLNTDNKLWGAVKELPLGIKSFFAYKGQFFGYKDSLYTITVNPIFNLGVGRSFNDFRNVSYNARGLEMYGSIYKNLSFYTFVTDNISFPANYVVNYVGDNKVFPTANLTKPLPGGGYNFLQARAYLSFNPIKPLNFQFGHDRHFIGDGYRSFILSDFGREYLFGRANFTSKRINFMFMGAQMINQHAFNWQNRAEKKYVAMHHLSLNLGKKLTLGLFETIIFSRTDSNGNNSGFDFSYANPLVFYRAVEHGLNSSDNAMLGLNFKYLPIKKVMLYGQMVLDEFKISEVMARNGWYANKYALQAGFKWVNPFKIDGLSIRLEHNRVRPYTFMHFKRAQSFVHNNIPLGHPLGSNFEETIVILRYQFHPRWAINISAMHYLKGYDKANKNYGGDIVNKEYVSAVNIYGNYIGQGEPAEVTFAEVHVNYQMWHNLHLDISYLQRDSNSKLLRYHNRTEMFSVGLRYNIGRSNFFML